MTRAAAYLRISRDEAGEGLGIERQFEAVKSLCAQKGWELDERWVIRENNRSAWDDSKPRQGFQRLMRGIEAGEVRAVAVYAFDRLARRRKDVALVLDAVEKHGVPIAASAGNLDLSTHYGRGIAGVLGALAGMEIAAMQDRLRAKAQQNASAGKVHNGGHRPYGYELDRKTVRPDEAEVIRGMAGHLLDGGSLTAISRELNSRGRFTAYGTRWDTRKVKDVLDNPRLCGRVRFRGEVLPGVRGQWETILSESEFDALQIAIAARRKVNDRWTNDRRHLLSGALLRCGMEGCGRKIHAFKQTSGVWAYRCPGHLSRDQRSVDAHVVREVAAYALDNPIRVAEWHRPQQQDLSEQIRVLEKRKADAVAAFAEHGGDPAALAMLTADLQARIEALRDRQVDQIVFETGIDWAQFDMTRILARPAEDPARIDQQRAAIVLFVESITLRPAKRKGRGYDESGTEIKFRDPNRLVWQATVEE